VPLTLVKDGFALSLSLTSVQYSKTAKPSLTSVIDNSEKFLTSLNNVSNACFADIVDTDETLK
jgi:hypothetical protein